MPSLINPPSMFDERKNVNNNKCKEQMIVYLRIIWVGITKTKFSARWVRDGAGLSD